MERCALTLMVCFFYIFCLFVSTLFVLRRLYAA